MKEIKVLISQDGKTAIGLYDDSIPYSKLGEMGVTRASDVFFDDTVQKWRIQVFPSNEILPEMFDTRWKAIEFEVSYLQKKYMPAA